MPTPEELTRLLDKVEQALFWAVNEGLCPYCAAIPGPMFCPAHEAIDAVVKMRARLGQKVVANAR